MSDPSFCAFLDTYFPQVLTRIITLYLGVICRGHILIEKMVIAGLRFGRDSDRESLYFKCDEDWFQATSFSEPLPPLPDPVFPSSRHVRHSGWSPKSGGYVRQEIGNTVDLRIVEHSGWSETSGGGCVRQENGNTIDLCNSRGEVKVEMHGVKVDFKHSYMIGQLFVARMNPFLAYFSDECCDMYKVTQNGCSMLKNIRPWFLSWCLFKEKIVTVLLHCRSVELVIYDPDSESSCLLDMSQLFFLQFDSVALICLLSDERFLYMSTGRQICKLELFI